MDKVQAIGRFQRAPEHPVSPVLLAAHDRRVGLLPPPDANGRSVSDLLDSGRLHKRTYSVLLLVFGTVGSYFVLETRVPRLYEVYGSYARREVVHKAMLVQSCLGARGQIRSYQRLVLDHFLDRRIALPLLLQSFGSLLLFLSLHPFLLTISPGLSQPLVHDVDVVASLDPFYFSKHRVQVGETAGRVELEVRHRRQPRAKNRLGRRHRRAPGCHGDGVAPLRSGVDARPPFGPHRIDSAELRADFVR